MPNAPWSRLNWSANMNDPYFADWLTFVEGVHRDAGTCVFTASARIDNWRNSEGVVIFPAIEKHQSMMLTGSCSLELETFTRSNTVSFS